MEERSYLNDSDTTIERRLAAEDRPQRFVVSSVWELPIARKSRLGGWQLQGIYTAQSGQPLNWGNVLYYGGDVGAGHPERGPVVQHHALRTDHRKRTALD